MWCNQQACIYTCPTLPVSCSTASARKPFHRISRYTFKQPNTTTMGNEASKPKPGTPFRVIAAGLPRTGTASMTKALSILLDGPVYHGGTQMSNASSADFTAWTRILRRLPVRTEADKELVRPTLAELTDGYAAMADYLGAFFAPELLELYPDAMVVCTVRDPDAWVKSMGKLNDNATVPFLRLTLLPLPGLRHFPTFFSAFQNVFGPLYDDVYPPTTKSHHRHIERLKNVVPEDRLVFIDVRDGWGPLCAALGMEVPDMPFPRVNDGEELAIAMGHAVGRGVKAWGVILGAVVGVVSMGMYLGRSGWSFG